VGGYGHRVSIAHGLLFLLYVHPRAHVHWDACGVLMPFRVSIDIVGCLERRMLG
jgi:hypothetical protein